MKVKQLYQLIVLLLFLIPKVNFALPDIGSTPEFALLTSTGDTTNNGFGNISGITYDTDGTGTYSAADFSVLYNDPNTTVSNFPPANGAMRNDDLSSNGQRVSVTPFIKGKSARGPNSGTDAGNKARVCDEVIVTQPVDTDVCNGTTMSFSVVVTGTGMTYQWRKDGVDLNEGPNVIGSNTATLTLDNVSPGDNGMYSVVITTTCPATLISEDAELTVHVPVAISKEPASVTLCEGGQAIFDINATGGPQVNYQWRKGTTNLVDGGNISGVNTEALTIDPVTLADAAADYNVVVTGHCPVTAISIDAALVVDGSVNITAQPSNQSVCTGNPAAFTVGATGAGLTYQWRMGNTNLVDGGNISGATTATLTINPATASDIANNYNVVVSSAGSCPPGTMTSVDASLDVNDAAVITLQPSDLTVCEGDPATFTVAASGPGLTYQWRRNGVNLADGGDISGSTTTTLTINNASNADEANYSVVVSGACPSPVISADAGLTVNEAPVIISQPDDQALCAGNTATFTVDATGAGLTYQWRMNGVNLSDGGDVSGSNTSTLTIDNITIADEGDYSVVVTGTCPGSDISANAGLTINISPVITVQPSNQTVCDGSAAIFTVNVSGNGLSYQWRKGTTNLVDGGNISGATNSSLIINPATSADAATDYNVVITGSCPMSTTSADASLTIMSSPVITVQPIDQTICEGNAVNFSVSATGAGLTYQWMQNGVNLTDGGDISGSTTSSLTINNASVTDEADYSVVVSGACPVPAVSVDGTLTVNESPSITLQPANQLVCSGSTATFSVGATGAGLTYQWRRNGVNLADGGDISGSTTSSLSIANASLADEADYSVVITGTCPSAVTSANATLTIGTAPVIVIEPADETVCEGDAATFTVTATGSGLTYQWRQGTNNMIDGGRISGATTAALTFDPTMTGDASANYNVVVSGSCGSVTSANVSLNVNQNTVIATQPANQVVCSGSTATFSVGATGAGLTYQWRRNGVNLADGGDISGSATETLTIDNASAADNGDYSVVITGICTPSFASNDASLLVQDTPLITAQPSDLTICEGNVATLSVSAIGTGLTYQWRVGSTNLVNDLRFSGVTTSTLTIDPVNSIDAAPDYNVVITGTCPGSTTSVDVTLSVNTPPVIFMEPVDQSVCQGATATFTAGITGNDLIFQWRRNGVDLTDGGDISGATTATLTITNASIADEADYSLFISGYCPPITTASASLTVNESPVITVQPINETVCENGLVNMIVTATGANLTYQWRRGTTNLSDGGTISGSTSSTMTISPVSLADAGTDYNVVVSGICPASVTSVNVELTVNTAPVITVEPTTQTVCEGDAVSFTVNASGTGLSYQWRKGTLGLVDAGTISGVTTSTLTIDPVTATDAATDFNVVVTGTCPDSAFSVDVSLIINTAPSITLQPANQVVCSGNTATFSVGATGPGLTYQWRQNGVNLIDGGDISGSTTSSLNIANASLADEANYSVVITGVCPSAVTSASATLTIDTAPVIVVEPVDETVCEGDAATFTVTATGTGLTYQWRQGTNNMIDDGRITGATSATLTLNPTMAGDASANYNVIVSGSCGSSVTSVNADLTINTAPVITSQPVNQTVCQGSTVTFTVGATGTGLTYQWMQNGINLTDGGDITGSATATLTIDNASLSDNGDYSVMISGACPAAVTSLNASLTIEVPAAITVQPSDMTVCEGSPVSFTVGAIGSGLTYQWRQGTNNMIDDGRISGATSATLTFDPTMAGDASANYNVIVSGNCGSSVTSVDVQLTIENAPVITVQPVSMTVCEGTPVSFTVGATGSGLTYQWRKGGVDITDGGSFSGATSSTFTIDPVSTINAGTDYNVFITGNCGNSTSVDVVLNVNTAPVITVQPVDQSVCEGSEVIFEVTATGTGLIYQWRRGTINMVDGITVTGSTTSSMTISPVTLADAANDYNVIVSGNCGSSVTSIDVMMTVDPAPVITVQPISQTVCEGESASFSVTATGVGLTYQWQRNGTDLVNGGNISGATSTTLTIDPVNAGDASTAYNVIVTGNCPATSVDVSLNVNTAPAILAQPVSQVVCPGGSVTYSVTASGSGLTYQWRKGATNLVDGGNISGSTTSALTINPVTTADVATNYNCFITGTCPSAVTTTNAALTLDIAPSITVEATNQTVCEGDPVSFSIDAVGTGLTYQWRQGTTNLVNGGNISGATTATLTIDPTLLADAGTNYNVIVSGTCPGSATSNNYTLTVNPVPNAVASSNSPICLGAELNLNAQAVSGATYVWTGPNGYTSDSQNPVITSVIAADAGTYTLTVTANNCSATDDVELVISDCDITIKVPGGFSPNGDQNNDAFVIDGIEKFNASFKVFNRWGQLIFEADSYQNDWEGKGPSGEVLPTGVYFFILDLKDGSEHIKGTIYLNR